MWSLSREQGASEHWGRHGLVKECGHLLTMEGKNEH
jgi:hypothetical protein